MTILRRFLSRERDVTPMQMRYSRRRHMGRALRDLGVAVLLAPLAACDALDRALAVETPSRLPAAELDQPRNAGLIVNSAEIDLSCALGSFIVAGGMMAGEFADATQTAARWDFDRRTVQSPQSAYATNSCVGLGVYRPISTARYTADTAVAKLQGWTDEQVDDRQLLIARAANSAGYSLLLLGEAFCSAAVAGGPELQKDEIFAEAETRFTTALTAAQAAGDADQTSLAYAGRARARRNLNRMADAVADARLVPAGFVHNATYDQSIDRRQNRVFAQNNSGLAISVGEAYRGATYAGVVDPRIAVRDANRLAGDRATPLWVQTKYDTLDSPIPLASYDEAQLIIAEGVGGAEAVGIINALHAEAGLPPFTAASETEIQRQVIEERRRELFVEGQRLFDLWRYRDPASPLYQALVPVPGTPYPKGGSYQDQRCMPLPDVERLNNPNIPDQVAAT